MNPHLHMSAMIACLAIGACASAPPSRTVGQAPAAREVRAPSNNTQPESSGQRNRQFQRAEALYLSGHLKDAAAAFQDLTHAYPNDARIWLKYGNTLTKLGSYDDAASAFQTSSTLDPSQGGAAFNLALVRIAQTRDALDVALTRLAPDSAEHTQAQALQRQVATLVGPANPAGRVPQ
jgi:TolA-binding protein